MLTLHGTKPPVQDGRSKIRADSPAILQFPAPPPRFGPIGTYTATDDAWRDALTQDDLPPVTAFGLMLECIVAGEEYMAETFRNTLRAEHGIAVEFEPESRGRRERQRRSGS